MEKWQDKGFDAFMQKQISVPPAPEQDYSKSPTIFSGGSYSGNFTIQNGNLSSSNFVSGTSGWQLTPTDAQLVSITLIGGTLKYGKTSFSDSTNAGYWLGATGWYIGAVSDATYIKYTLADASFAVKANLNTTAGSSIDGQYLVANSVASASANLAMRGWTFSGTFSATTYRLVTWTAGTFTASDGTAYSILTGNTGNMAALTYIYLDIAVSTTALQTTTTAATAIGNGKVLIAVAQNNTDITSDATFQVYGGAGGQVLLVNNIAANSASTNEFVSNSAQIANLVVTDAKINTLSANKIVAGTGIIANLDVLSTLTMGSAATNGTIQSYGWNGTANGFQILGGATPSITVIGGTITGGTVQTATSGKRITITGTTLSAYDASGNEVGIVNGDGFTSPAIFVGNPVVDIRTIAVISNNLTGVQPTIWATAKGLQSVLTLIADNAANASAIIDITNTTAGYDIDGTASTWYVTKAGAATLASLALTTDLAVSEGGTGKSSWTQYLIPYADTTTSFSQIAIGTSGQVLTSNGAGVAPSFQGFEKLKLTTLADTGAANAYVITPSTAISDYEEGQIFLFKAANANTLASTLNVNSKGLRNIVKKNKQRLNAGDIALNMPVLVNYVSTAGATVDSYSETNNDGGYTLNSGSTGYYGGVSQSFIVSDDNSYKITSAKFYLKKSGSPTGTAVAKLWTHSGTYGTSSVPANAPTYALVTAFSEWDEANRDADYTLNADNYLAVAQAFANSNPSTLGHVQFYLKKANSPTGPIVAKLYAHSGTFGTDSVPTGAALATSDPIDASTLTTSSVLYTFHFSGANQYVMTDAFYVVSLEYSTSSNPNTVLVGKDTGVTVAACGNASYNNGSWNTLANIALCYHIKKRTEGSGLLATSGTLDVSTLTTDYVLKTFTFTGANQAIMLSQTNYVLTIEYSSGDTSNYVLVGNDSSSPTHGGNAGTSTVESWTAVAGTDLNFYVYGSADYFQMLNQPAGNINKIYTSTADITASNTANETTLMTTTLPGGTLGTSGAVRIKILISADNGQSSADAWTFKLKYGGTTVITQTDTGGGSGHIHLKNWVEFLLIGAGTTASQEGGLGYAWTNNAAYTPISAVGTATEDSTVDKTLAVTWQWSGAIATSTMTMHQVIVEKII